MGFACVHLPVYVSCALSLFFSVLFRFGLSFFVLFCFVFQCACLFASEKEGFGFNMWGVERIRKEMREGKPESDNRG